MGDYDLVKTLLEMDADPNITNKHPTTPLHDKPIMYAVINKDEAAVNYQFGSKESITNVFVFR